jgi:hypothetical protein
MKKELFNIAWSFIKDGIFTKFADALRAAWNKMKLTAALKKGVAYFTFRKVDGTQRKAIGTLNNTNFQYENKGSDRKTNSANVCYWDVEARGFRSFRIENFLCFN